MVEVKPGSKSTEWKIVVANYIVGLILMAGGLFLEHEGKDATTIMTLAVGFLSVNGISYGAMRTFHKTKAVETFANLNGSEQKVQA